MLGNISVTHSQKTTVITGYHLKMIALITMLIDHIGAVVVWRLYAASFQITASMQLSDFLGDKLVVWVSSHQEIIYTIYEWLRYVGRMAFPIYCFLLVEGFLHTRSVAKYALRLFVFALISEIPFDLALTGQWWNTDYSNVFFTLVFGLISVWAVSYVERLYEFWQEKQWEPILGTIITAGLGILVVALFGGLAEMVLHTDYGFAGVVAILIFYLFRRTREMAFVLSVMSLCVFSSSIEILALLMLLPLVKYDGTRGKHIKYVFYAFYPAHLLILALICICLGV